MANTYIGMDGKARKIKNMYIGVDGVARKVKNTYIGVDGAARQAYTSLPDGILYSYGKTGKLAGGWNDIKDGAGDMRRGYFKLEDNRILLHNEAQYSYISMRTSNTFDLSKFHKLQVVYNNPHKYKQNYGARLTIGLIGSKEIARKIYWDDDIIQGTSCCTMDFNYAGEGYFNIRFGITFVSDDYYVRKSLYLYEVILL